MEYLAYIDAIVLLMSILFFIIGMASPGAVIFWGKDETKTRAKVAVIYLSIAVISFCLMLPLSKKHKAEAGTEVKPAQSVSGER